MLYTQAKFFIVLFLTLLFSEKTPCQNLSQDFLKENHYKEISRGIWKEYFAITYQNQSDTNYFIRKLYNDSTCNDSIYFKYFFFKDIMNGPYEVYWFGKIGIKGNMKDNKRNGEELLFNEKGNLAQRSFYKAGKKTGIWEYFDSRSKLLKKIYYNSEGRFVKQEIYNKQGKIVRTESVESREY